MRKTFVYPLLMLLLLLFTVAPARAAGDVVVIDAEGVVSPGMAAYFERAIAEAVEADASAIVIELDTPGGMLDATTDIIKSIRTSSVPVIVYVGPAGAQAGSAGAIITFAGHANAMAPETAIGAASPIDGSGADIDDTLYNKIVEFMTAEVRSLTEARGEEAQELAQLMITEARAVSASEALDAGLVDLIANDRDDLLAQMDGRTVLLNGEEVVLETAGLGVVSAEISALERFQMLLASNTELIGLLLSIGGLAIMIELRAPGGYIAGAVGVICLGLAFYGLGQIPPNFFGLGLILVAFILFILETQTPTFGVLTLTGAIALVGGLMLLFNTEDAPDFVRISIWSALGIAIPIFVMFGGIAIAMARVQRSKAKTGTSGLIGARGVVRKAFKPTATGFKGTVFLNGELWTAVSAEALPTDWPIIVDSIDGFTLHITKLAALPEAQTTIT